MRTFYLDLARDDETTIHPGDVIGGPKKRWTVAEAWPTDSKVWENRWTLKLNEYRDGDSTRLPVGRRVISTVPYRRGEGPEDVFGREHEGTS